MRVLSLPPVGGGAAPSLSPMMMCGEGVSFWPGGSVDYALGLDMALREYGAGGKLM